LVLPDHFSPSEHLQDLLKRYFNREVREWFSDLGGDEWEPDIGTTRGSLRVGCTHLDNDNLDMTILRIELFNFIRRQKFEMPFLGIPLGQFQETRRYRPQIMLYFQEDVGDIEPGYSPVTGEVSFRLMDHNSSTINEAVANTFANRVKSNFLNGGGYVWRKGKTMVSYTDKAKGYQLQLYSRSEAYGRELIERVLDVQNDTPDWSKCNVSENQSPTAAYPTIPELDYVYGKSRRMPRKRPMADCRFQFALLHVWGLPNPIVLADRSGLYAQALVR